MNREYCRMNQADNDMKKIESSGRIGRCILVCAGEYVPVRDAAWRLEKRPGDFVIAVDGGLFYLMREGIKPDMILGDFDSLDDCGTKEERAALQELLGEYEEKGTQSFHRLPVVKDDTDTMAAARAGIGMGYREFVIYGALGGRLDHTMANVQTLLWIRRHGGHAWLAADGSRATVIEAEELEIPAGFEGTVSVFALDKTLRGVEISGLLYNVQDAEITNDYPIGCSNEKLAGAPGRIRIAEGAALVVMIDKLINRH